MNNEQEARRMINGLRDRIENENTQDWATVAISIENLLQANLGESWSNDLYAEFVALCGQLSGLPSGGKYLPTPPE